MIVSLFSVVGSLVIGIDMCLIVVVWCVLMNLIVVMSIVVVSMLSVVLGVVLFYVLLCLRWCYVSMLSSMMLCMNVSISSDEKKFIVSVLV